MFQINYAFKRVKIACLDGFKKALATIGEFSPDKMCVCEGGGTNLPRENKVLMSDCTFLIFD